MSHDSSSISPRTSSTFDDKQFLLEDDASVHPMKTRSKRACFRGPAAMLTLNLVFLVSALAVWTHVHFLLRNLKCDGGKKQDDFEPDLLFDTPITFQPHYYYGGPPSNTTNEMWQRLSPPGDGIVEIPNQFTSGLPPSLPAQHNPDTHTVYGVSMFHQLHCLNFLRYAYVPETVKDMPPHEVTVHRDHCLDYIRQAIMCHGDATLEPMSTVGINGMGAVHQCRNFERMFSWAYEHRSDKVTGSGYKDGVLTHTPGHQNSFGDGMEDDSD